MTKKKNISGMKLFVVRKYIWAYNAAQAIKVDRRMPADEVWVDDEWKKKMAERPDAMGFLAPQEENDV